MAAVDGRRLNLEEFVGLNWSCWVDAVNILTSDAGTCPQGASKYARRCREHMSLWKEDMHIYGECPSRDNFYLVVCSHCGQVVKPQAFQRHCERRHSLLPKTCAQWRNLAPQPRPRPGFPVNLSPSTEDVGHLAEVTLGPNTASPCHQYKSVNSQKEDASLSPAVNLPLPHQSASTLQNGGLTSQAPGLGCSSYVTISSSKRAPTLAAERLSGSPAPPLQGTITHSRICTNSEMHECDLKNPSCAPEPQGKKTPCKRTESASVALKRRAGGRHVEQHHVDKQKLTNVKNCHILRATSKRFPEDEAGGTVRVEVQTPYPFNQGLLSSEENEDNEREDATDLPATSWHPKPLGLCTFGCRTLGCSIFTFDRRLHHLRFALAAMLERHVSTHLWKKIPQTSSTLRSPRVAGSSVQSGPGRSPNLAASTSQLERTPQGTKVPPSTRGQASDGKKSHHLLSSSSNHRPLGQKRKCDGDSQCQRLSHLPCTECVSWTGDGVRNLRSCAPGNGKTSKKSTKDDWKKLKPGYS
ncbi:ataxin-7-like protein 2 isoform X2 [Syngnathoides biaculeatus]|uniref:ataxin-7-like protein 2 isoform X2 n=1 Tax=Syngnathoides biaculeatus TaxID=300417 RepID=UPI002ADD9E41|nr:ataxin-7-like protein 2 isoform X2 [Syngnathoides biaculeatus]